MRVTQEILILFGFGYSIWLYWVGRDDWTDENWILGALLSMGIGMSWTLFLLCVEWTIALRMLSKRRRHEGHIEVWGSGRKRQKRRILRRIAGERDDLIMDEEE